MDNERAGCDQPANYYTAGTWGGVSNTAKPNEVFVEIYPPTNASLPQFYDQPYVNNTNVVFDQPRAHLIEQDIPPDYIIPSVFVAICFLPTGILAIIYAWKARQLIKAGKWDYARIMSDRARNLIFASIIIGLLCFVGYLIVQFKLIFS